MSSALVAVAFLLFVSGLSALVYEVVWLRVVSLALGYTVYAAAIVLAAVMAGLGLGAALFGRRSAAARDLVRLYGWLEIGVGASAALTQALLEVLPRLLGTSAERLSLDPVAIVAILIFLLPPSVLMGGTLPVLAQAVTRQAGTQGRR